MRRHGKHARAEHELELTLRGDDAPAGHGIEILHDRFPADEVPDDTGGPTAAGCEAEEPEEYGVRVSWQSEAAKIEAAEFLVATRIQQDARLRTAQDLERLRHPEQD